MLELVEQAVAAGANRRKACALVGVSARTEQRYRNAAGGVDGRKQSKRVPGNRLRDLERTALLAACNEPAYRNLPPEIVVAGLADEGRYLGSASTMYRELAKANQRTHRGKSKRRVKHQPNQHCATAPHQLWAWDITYLNTTVRGVYYYAYVIMDVWSRMIVGCVVHERENSELSSSFMEQCWRAAGIDPLRKPTLVLHADNGSAMKGATMLATLERLGVMPSFSRPRVSDDNAFIESLFKTLKYCPEYPAGGLFASVDAATEWMNRFVRWYNGSHRHSALRYVTPSQRHDGTEVAILAKRDQVFAAARATNPARWTGATHNWQPIGDVHLNRRGLRNDAKAPRISPQEKERLAA